MSDISKSPASSGTKAPKPDQGLAGVMERAFQTNGKAKNDEVEEEEGGEDEVEMMIRPPEGYKMTSVYPPSPCDRCKRTNKVCKLSSGTRCESCKALHQKCSIANGPTRARPSVPVFKAHASDASAAPRSKRKAPMSNPAKPKKSSTPDEEDELDDDDDEEGDDSEGMVPPKAKKRRAAAPPASSQRRGRLLKHIVELEDSIRRIRAVQISVATEVLRLQQIGLDLSMEIHDLD